MVVPALRIGGRGIYVIWQGAAISASIRAWSLAGFAVRSRCSLRGGLTSQLIGVHSTDKVAAALRPPPAASLSSGASATSENAAEAAASI